MLDLLKNLTDEELNRVKKMLNIEEIQARMAKNDSETDANRAMIAKLNAETAKIQQEMRFYPLLTAGGTAIFLFILNLIAKKFGFL